jgi:hypothetical protein
MPQVRLSYPHCTFTGAWLPATTQAQVSSSMQRSLRSRPGWSSK